MNTAVKATWFNRGFTPTDVDGLALWLDASDESTITESSGAVSQWDDKSGNGNHVTQATAASQPSTGLETLNGRNVLSHGTDDFLYGPYPHTGSVVTVFFVGVEASTVFALHVATTSTITTQRYVGLVNDGDTSTQIENGFSGTITYAKNGGTPLDPADRNALHEYITPGPFIARIEGAIPAGTLVNFKTSYSASLTFTGKWAEHLVWNRALMSDEISQVEQNLAAKWGVTL